MFYYSLTRDNKEEGINIDFSEYLNQINLTQEQNLSESYDYNIQIQYLKENLSRFEIIFNSIESSPESLYILDVGTTFFTFFIKHKFPHYQIATIDRTNLMETPCKDRGIKIMSLNLDDVSIPFPDDYFDVVIFTEVLEHIFAPPTQMLKEVYRIIKPGGKLILSVPNIARLSNRVKLLFGRSPLEHGDKQLSKEYVHGHGHIHEYTMKEILALLENCNLFVTEKFYCSQSLLSSIYRSEKNNLNKIIKIVYYSLCQLIPSFRYTIFTESIKPKRC